VTGAIDRIGPSESQAAADAEARYRRKQQDEARLRHDEKRANERAAAQSAQREARRSMPRTLDGLLHWYAGVIEDEKPTALHARAVWNARQRYDEKGEPMVPSEEVGGSALGTRAYHDPMRRTLENSPHELDDDGYYVRPLASALARMRSGSEDRPALRDTPSILLFLGHNPAEWRNVADHLEWPVEPCGLFLHRALEMLWLLYRPRPAGPPR
jgi:hypothetical protein